MSTEPVVRTYPQPLRGGWWLGRRSYFLYVVRELTVVFMVAWLVWFLFQVGALKAAGFRNVKVADATLTLGSRGSFDYLVSSESLRAQARSGGSLEQALNSSVPIAAFGSGARRLVIQQATEVSAAAVRARARAARRPPFLTRVSPVMGEPPDPKQPHSSSMCRK